MRFDLVYTDRAKRDLMEATDSIAFDAPITAARWFQGFVLALERLRSEATIYSVAPESDRCSIEVRQFLHRTKSRRVNRALYTIRGSVVYILAIRRPGQELLTAEELEKAVANLK